MLFLAKWKIDLSELKSYWCKSYDGNEEHNFEKIITNSKKTIKYGNFEISKLNNH